jgi:hypothetical protein
MDARNWIRDELEQRLEARLHEVTAVVLAVLELIVTDANERPPMLHNVRVK